MERQRWIDICKGLAIIFVIIGHVVTSYYNSGLYIDSPVFNYVGGGVIYAFHMPLFFMISGYLRGISRKQPAIRQVIKKRAISYGVPYIIFSALIVFSKIVASPFVNNKLEAYDFVKIVWYPINSLWFVYALLIITIIHEIGYKYVGENPIRKTIFLSFFFGLMVLADLTNENKLFSNTILQDSILIDVLMYAFWYELGVYLPVVKMAESISNGARNKSIICLSLSILLYIYAIILLNNYNISFMLIRYIMALLGSVLVIGLSCIIKKSRPLELLGQITFPIYILHPYIVSGLKVLFTRFHIFTSMDVVVITLVSLFSILLSVMGYMMIKKFKVFDFCFYPLRYIEKQR